MLSTLSCALYNAMGISKARKLSNEVSDVMRHFVANLCIRLNFCLFSNSMMTFILLRMFAAFSSVGFWTTFFVYAMEMVGGKWKAFLGIGFEFPWAIAYSILPGIGKSNL